MCVIKVAGGDEFTGIANAASEYLGLTGRAEAETVYCGKEESRHINFSTRGVDKATDVLSYPALALAYGSYKPFTAENFPLDVNPDGGRVTLGSIVICDDVAKEQAEEYGHSLSRERGYLFLHGLLHLLGYDHVTDYDKKAMRKAEEDILQTMGINR